MLSNRNIIFYIHWEYRCCPIETSFSYTLGISMLSNRNIFLIYIGNINVVQLKHLFNIHWEYQCCPIETSVFHIHWEYQCCPIETSFLYTLGTSMLSLSYSLCKSFFTNLSL